MGQQLWFIPIDIGVAFIKREFEHVPFIKVVYLPSCRLVGPLHRLEHIGNGWAVHDDHRYEDAVITDGEFIRLYKEATQRPVQASKA